MADSAKFALGQLIDHRLFDYRGVVYDVDPVFMGSEEWYQQMARSRPPKDAPWYRVLVHDAEHETYVAERNLVASENTLPIRHPLIDVYFERVPNGEYRLKRLVN